MNLLGTLYYNLDSVMQKVGDGATTIQHNGQKVVDAPPAFAGNSYTGLRGQFGNLRDKTSITFDTTQMRALNPLAKTVYAISTNIIPPKLFDSDFIHEKVNIVDGGSILIAEAKYKDFTTNGVSNVKKALYIVLKATGKFKNAELLEINFDNPVPNKGVGQFNRTIKILQYRPVKA